MTVTNYIWDMVNDNVLAETDENTDLTAEYTYEPDHFGNLISQQRTGAERLYHFDGQGSTRALTDENGDVTDAYTYSAFGEHVSKTGTSENPYRYVGEKGYDADEETAGYYVRRRNFSPSVARWRSCDSMPFVDSTNHFLYVVNNPMNHSDPSGLTEYIDCLARSRNYQALSRAHPKGGWLKCVAEVSYLVCQLAAFSSSQGWDAKRKASWLYCMNKCIFEQFLQGYDFRFPKEGRLKEMLPRGPSIETRGHFEEVSCCFGVGGKSCCEHLEDTEQRVTEVCMGAEECGRYKTKDWGALFSVPGLDADFLEYAKQRFGVTVPDFKGDYNEVDDRIEYGNRLCCASLPDEVE